MSGRHGQPLVPLHKKLQRKHWIAICVGGLATALLATAGTVAAVKYWQAGGSDAITAYSINDLISNSRDVSRSNLREALHQGQGGATADTSYVKVIFNGQNRIVVGTDFTTVKSVLEAGHITLEPTDSITPALNEKVTESTVIRITRANSEIQTTEQDIAYNTVKVDDPSLPEGTTRITKKGENGVMEQVNLVTRSGQSVVSTSTITAFVKKAPVNEEVRVGSKKSASASSGSVKLNLGSTTPIGEAQAIAHEMVLARGWSESDFTALVNLWNRESGWRTNASNRSSGAYGIPQALPGSKMSTAGPDWQNNATTQITWGLSYIAGRYGTPSKAWSAFLAKGWY